MKQQKPTLNQLKWYENQIFNCKTLEEISVLLNCSKNELLLHSYNPEYYQFSIPKKSGTFRIIEAPNESLKRLQRNLNQYLQAVYYLNQSVCSYGYVISILGEKQTKNIYTNATQHLAKPFMLNTDFKDFFHQIKIDDVTQIFKSEFFNFDIYTATTLAKLCCYKDRLPMGTPTSPVLSNLYTLKLDNELLQWAKKHNTSYTRFVDDLTFSSVTTSFSPLHFKQINEIALRHKLNFNEEKTRYLNSDDIKTVTGLVLNTTVDIDNAYYLELGKDLIRLKNVMEVYYITGKTHIITFLKTFKQELFGKINFIGTIEGRNSKQFLNYLNLFYNALEPDTDLVQRWTKFSNYV
ncbi:reverse transcriptase family protein [Lutibacter maritimus]|uniref:RNA-directed DNA polymerase n=1 Tax=Lutibacter maritimus TaxID=593133 RepID=A0A1I6SRB9_9FLAO|nr:reverse transcriptase family protein [Lutibacter maritimus]SFS79440.1 RNA-directed DNA polymerase [Lutibacter maritimus]